MSMLWKSWGYTKVVCGNHPDGEEPEMVVKSGSYSVFYACPHYNSILTSDDVCMNRINLVEYEKMLSHIADELLACEERNESLNLVHHKWRQKSAEFEIIQHNKEGITVKMIDRLAIKGHRA